MPPRTILSVALAVSVALFGLGVWDGHSVSDVRAADAPCPIGQMGRQLVRSPRGDCVDDTSLSTEALRILAAKQAYAAAFASFKAGTGTQAQVDSAARLVEALTGDTLAAPPGQVGGGSTPLAGTLAVPSYAQINGYYCGPATAQNIVRYLVGGSASAVLDTVTGVHDVLNGDPNHDQPIFGNDFWLSTTRLTQTPWTTDNHKFIPHALNDFKGVNFYIPTAVGPGLDQSSAWVDIDSDVNSYHPVAENPWYGSSTFYPTGFAPLTQGYYHWDTIFGDNSSFYVGVAQSYASPGQTRVPYQWWGWWVQWPAIAANHGIVW